MFLPQKMIHNYNYLSRSIAAGVSSFESKRFDEKNFEINLFIDASKAY